MFKKSKFFIGAIPLFCFGMVLTVSADSTVNLKSTGRIEAENIVIDADDFITIEDAIESAKAEAYAKAIEDINKDPAAFGIETTKPQVINFSGSSVWKHPDGIAGGGGSLSLDTTNYSKMVVDNVSNGTVSGSYGRGQHAVGVSCSLGNPTAGRATTYDLTNVNSVSFRVSNWSGAGYEGQSDVSAGCRITLYP